MSYSLWPHGLQPSRLLCPWGFSRQEYWFSCCPPRDLPDPGIEPTSLRSSTLAGGFFTTSATWEASSVQFSSFQSLSRVPLFATPWTATCQASLSITNSRSLLRLTSLESVMPSNHLILCCPLRLLPLKISYNLNYLFEGCISNTVSLGDRASAYELRGII